MRGARAGRTTTMETDEEATRHTGVARARRRALGALRGRLGAPALARRCRFPACPRSWTGCAIVHLSDFHLGFPSRGERAVERAIEWAAAREPDLVLITGDLLSRPGAEPRLRELLDACPGRLPCSATTTSRTRATRSRSRAPSPISPRRPSSSTRLGSSSFEAGACRSSASTRARIGSERRARASSPIQTPTCASCSATSRT